jgi:hypothetical protein
MIGSPPHDERRVRAGAPAELIIADDDFYGLGGDGRGFCGGGGGCVGFRGGSLRVPGSYGLAGGPGRGEVVVSEDPA